MWLRLSSLYKEKNANKLLDSVWADLSLEMQKGFLKLVSLDF
jgi:hypothetical protein